MSKISVAVTSLQWRHNEHGCVSNHQQLHCLLNCWFRRRSKKTSKLHVTDFCAGNSPGTGEFPAQMASNAENVSICWGHDIIVFVYICRRWLPWHRNPMMPCRCVRLRVSYRSWSTRSIKRTSCCSWMPLSCSRTLRYVLTVWYIWTDRVLLANSRTCWVLWMKIPWLGSYYQVIFAVIILILDVSHFLKKIWIFDTCTMYQCLSVFGTKFTLFQWD